MKNIYLNPDAVATAPPAPEEVEILAVRGTPQTFRLFEDTKGKAKGKARCRAKFDVTQPDPYSAFKKAIGVENFNRMVIDAINDHCDDAADDARNAEGTIDLRVFADKLPEQFVRGGGSKTGVKELRKQFEEKSNQLAPLLDKKLSGTATQAELMEFARVFAEWKELSAKKEAKSRHGEVKPKTVK
jgi:hypothetical protein